MGMAPSRLLGISEDIAFAALDLLVRVEAARPAGFGRFGALAVDDPAVSSPARPARSLADTNSKCRARDCHTAGGIALNRGDEWKSSAAPPTRNPLSQYTGSHPAPHASAIARSADLAWRGTKGAITGHSSFVQSHA